MQEIEIKKSSSLGGLKKVVLIECDAIDSISVVDGLASISLLDETRSYGVAFRVQTAEFRESTKSTKDGIAYRQRVSFSITKDRLGLRNYCETHKETDFCIITKDANGQYRLIGSQENPARFDFSFSTGKAPSSLNEYDFDFFCEAIQSAYFLSDLSIEDKIFDDTFDDTFE